MVLDPLADLGQSNDIAVGYLLLGLYGIRNGCLDIGFLRVFAALRVAHQLPFLPGELLVDDLQLFFIHYIQIGGYLTGDDSLPQPVYRLDNYLPLIAGDGVKGKHHTG